MSLGNLEFEMPTHWHFSRVDTVELKSQIFKKLGREKAEKYFYHLRRLLSFKLSKSDFNKLCYDTIGRENLALHNLFIRSILKNACLAHGPAARQTNTGHSWSSKISNGNFRDAFPTSPHKGRSVNSHDRRFRDHPSPLRPFGKMPSGNTQEISNSCDLQRPREHQNVQDLISVDSKALLEVVSVEDGEEVEQLRSSPGIQSRSPVRAPLGIPPSIGGISRKYLRNGPAAGFNLPMSEITESCCNCSELPDTRSLRKRLERKLEHEGLGLSVECVNLLNNGLDAYLKRLIRPCMEIARARCSNERMYRVSEKLVPGINGVWRREYVQRSNQCFSASQLDFRVAMELNPELLGEDWPVQLEKICLHTSEE